MARDRNTGKALIPSVGFADSSPFPSCKGSLEEVMAGG